MKTARQMAGPMCRCGKCVCDFFRNEACIYGLTSYYDMHDHFSCIDEAKLLEKKRHCLRDSIVEFTLF